ncbi:MAG: pyrroline-5-carboxylate reductase [Oscillospiraceae bacterium]|jgi:pyrroline-5-carboxylate reductase
MRYGFIGLGNMGSSIARGMSGSGKFMVDEICGYNRSPEKTEVLSREIGLIPCRDASEVVSSSQTIILCVKPQQMKDAIGSVQGSAFEGKLVITIAAGLPISYYQSVLPPSARIVRAMPNLNAGCLESVTGICASSNATEGDLSAARLVFESIGTVYSIDESMISAFSAVAGASPAFTFMYIDALAMAGVEAGMTRAQAQKAAAEAVMGTCRTLLESGEHPDVLRDRVCSPGGTTIEGVKVLEEGSFKGTVMDAVDAVIRKDRSLKK